MKRKLHKWLDGGSASIAGWMLAGLIVIASSGFAAGRNPNPRVPPVGSSVYHSTVE